jgi:hypothetical protein
MRRRTLDLMLRDCRTVLRLLPELPAANLTARAWCYLDAIIRGLEGQDRPAPDVN